LGALRWSLWRWPSIAAPLAVVGLTLVHTLFWTDLRMRAPIVPAIAIIAAGAGWPFSSREGNSGGHAAGTGTPAPSSGDR
ncbi:MAG: hypothetical protein ACYC61_28335, partial [Isosphaeraceae bacterium]